MDFIFRNGLDAGCPEMNDRTLGKVVVFAARHGPF